MRLLKLVLLFVFLACVPAGAVQIGGIAAVVNGEAITRYDIDSRVAAEAMARGINIGDPANARFLSRIRQETLERMIGNMILTQEAARLKVTVTESDIDAEMNNFLERSHLSREEFERQLTLQKMSEADFRKSIHDNILRGRLLSTMVGRKVVVTKEEIARYYEEHKSSFRSNQEVHFALLVYPPDADAEAHASRIASGAVSFEEVARSVSVGPRAAEGGDLGSVRWEDLDPAWQDRLAELSPEQVSPLFELNGFKAQLKLLDIDEGDGRSVEEAAEEIEKILREPKLQERFVEYQEQLRKRAVVEIRY